MLSTCWCFRDNRPNALPYITNFCLEKKENLLNNPLVSFSARFPVLHLRSLKIEHLGLNFLFINYAQKLENDTHLVYLGPFQEFLGRADGKRVPATENKPIFEAKGFAVGRGKMGRTK